MSEVFRKHYSYSETIPIIDTQVGMITDIYEVTGKPAPVGPYIKAVCMASAGPMKSLPLVVEPLQNSDSKVVHLTNIPVPISWVRTIDISLIFDFVNYRWMPSPEPPRENGLVTFDLKLRAAFSLLGRSYTLLLDHRPCSITLAKPFPVVQEAPVGTTAGFEGAQMQAGHPPSGQAEYGTLPYGFGRTEEQQFAQSTINGGSETGTLVTDQLAVEERLRQLGTKQLART